MSADTVRMEADFERAETVAVDAIPVVDLGRSVGSATRRAGTDEPAEASVVDALGEACRTIGFVYVTGHGIDDHLVEAMFEQIRAFFALPAAAKRQLTARPDAYRGYFPPRTTTEREGIDGGSMEAFRLMLDLPPDDPDVAAGVPLYGPNRWPAELPSFRVVMEAYQEAVLALATDLRRAFAVALGLPAGRFDPFFRKPLLNLQPAHYRGQPAGGGHRELGVGEHRDTGAFTMLMQDGTPGLEVRARDGRWIEAPVIPGAFVVNIGDSMMSWTNGEFVSTPHRVVNRSERDRYICALFMNPDYHCTVEPLDEFVGPDRPPRFEPVHNGEYWWAIAQADHAAYT